ncbi:MAG: hypothetical protein HYU52_09650 [Acidobacteria bacterium]|nr:hypothetical protein [Acidobacteriota bacterium]
MQCPKCGLDQASDLRECARCGVIFAKVQRAEPHAERQEPDEDPPAGARYTPTFIPAPPVFADIVEDGRLGRSELKILGFGLVSAIVVYALPFLRFVFSALVTLFHELGHAVVSWLLGHPAVPAFDFVYGGGFTHMDNFKLPIALAIGTTWAWLAWTVRGNRRTFVLVCVLAACWLFVVSSEWRRGLVVSAMGHGGEVLLASIFFYMALANVGFRIPEIERPAAAFSAFFVVIHTIHFAWRLRTDADFLAWYRAGKGGALMNDLESVALDLQIHTPLHPGIEGVAGWLIASSLIPFAFALLLFFKRSAVQRLVSSLLTADA